MRDNILDFYLISLTDSEFLVEGLTLPSLKDALKEIKNAKSETIKSFLKKYEGKIKKTNLKEMENNIYKFAKMSGIKKENVTTSKVMLKRFLGTVLVGISATVLFPITLACLIACIIRSINNNESIIKNVTSIIEEITSGIKTTRRTDVTKMEKAVITAGQATDYLWNTISSDPIVALKNFFAFLGMYIAAIFYFWKGIMHAGKESNT
jgi:hypothetical protein